ncbi:HyaD/HybD family hydrogenase maturation endopeptidase [Rhodopseudomonas sp. HC1]|uniref:HyaD/HybD family hydrogenase maturation endopeptidase n=1 Tax=Rhodopseudomonas infernalis TaxID=2897386 RepID=UPI001EE9A81C|nr:HyaD/HybD family hydrogenase maturation endopeptidase [Rhodopseudomonas infernalis]MCG6207419.1 HyaD/HybD family hydrogenase maturation endopeptidase [Rhodopseudomonas infernalis]
MKEQPTTSQPPRVLVLGIGNILWADEGFGVRAVEAFHRAFATTAGVTVMDGGTQGLYLVNLLQEHDHLLVFDAIDYGLPPGTLKRVDGDEVPKFTGAKKMSLHQTGFQEVLSAADLLGAAPRRLALIGCQPQDLEDWGGALTPRVAARIDDALALARDILAEWGVQLAMRDAAPVEPLLVHDLDQDSYEQRANPVVAAAGN